MWIIAGGAAAAAGLIAAIGALAVIAMRIQALRRRLSTLAARAAVQAIGTIGDDAGRIADALSELQSFEARGAAVAASFADAIGVALTMSADVRLVATSTESLLDTFVPSLRGSAAD